MWLQHCTLLGDFQPARLLLRHWQVAVAADFGQAHSPFHPHHRDTTPRLGCYEVPFEQQQSQDAEKENY
jgi:hypothetical protein